MNNFKHNYLFFVFLFLFLTACGADNFDASSYQSSVDTDKSKTSEPDQDNSAPLTIEQKFIAMGAPPKATAMAFEYYERNVRNFDNQRYLTIIDMDLHSSKKRFYLFDLQEETMKRFSVAHGRGSDENHDGYADTFSNINRSKMTSLGFYQVSETYHGKYGYSVRMDGLSSTNSRARQRVIVIHPANYVKEGAVKQGRSWGCPALDYAHSEYIIDRIRNGSLLLIYARGLENQI